MATVIRPAEDADIASITAIYAHHVLHGTGTFALEPPSESEMLSGLKSVQNLRLPYLVATEGNEILGFAYASPFRARPGYKYGVEDSLYLAPGHMGKGIGTSLLDELVALCTQRGLYHMFAVIGDRDNAASIGVHRACGFHETGSLPRAGFKFGRWLDVVFMMRDLLPRTDTPHGNGWAD